ncbi:hypothetical protein [Niabella ginsengisoli]|uniref:Uncharacterized protein n=1 Tax=Niabella ginsengisoli TaxID=522298 RepID=A0ABS9SKE2_9BACT|nr:hypothetical protein [Niabella ginsengisoli]MCH5598853.1 hypothetical protein [Niabella ginsengisoli]
MKKCSTTCNSFALCTAACKIGNNNSKDTVEYDNEKFDMAQLEHNVTFSTNATSPSNVEKLRQSHGSHRQVGEMKAT